MAQRNFCILTKIFRRDEIIENETLFLTSRTPAFRIIYFRLINKINPNQNFILFYFIGHECNVMYIILYHGEAITRVMQLNLLYLCGICQLVPLELWTNTALGGNHQPTYMPQLQPLFSAALVANVLHRKAWVIHVQWSKPHIISAPYRIRTRAVGFKIISGNHYTTTVHNIK